MRVTCLICVDSILQGQDVVATPCGHTFHLDCINEWLKRSKSCPQCRSKATEKALKKLFFDHGTADIETDPDSLQQQIDNLKFQMKLKEQEAKKYKEEAETCKAQAVALREEFRGSERELRDRDTTILALKTQLKYMEGSSTDAKKAREEAKQLREELKLLKGVEKVLTGTTEEVAIMMNSEATTQTGIKQLATFCAVLKKELSKTVDDRKRLRTETRIAERMYKDQLKSEHKLKQEVELLTTTVHHLEQENESLEKDNRSLKKKIGALEQAIASPSDDVRNSALHRLLCESPAPELLKRLHSADSMDSFTPEVLRKAPRMAMEVKKLELGQDTHTDPENESSEEDVVDLVTPPRAEKHLKTSSSRPVPDHLNIMKRDKAPYSSLHAKAGTSQAWKDRRLRGEQVGYDGLGGHHKVDQFPKPLPVLLRLSKKSKTLYRPAKAKGNTNTLTGYLQNTFED